MSAASKKAQQERQKAEKRKRTRELSLLSLNFSPCEWTTWDSKRRRVKRVFRCPYYKTCALGVLTCQDYFEWAERGGRMTQTAKVLRPAGRWLDDQERDDTKCWVWTEAGPKKIKTGETHLYRDAA